MDDGASNYELRVEFLTTEKRIQTRSLKINEHVIGSCAHDASDQSRNSREVPYKSSDS